MHPMRKENDVIPQMINGRSVQISARVPRMQCSKEFARIQSPELVRATNDWMADFFDYDELIPDGFAYELDKNTLVMNQSTWDKLKCALQEPTR
jgi:hypothetical protein